MAHPQIREAAVIGVPDPKWSERPLACVVLEAGAELTKQEVLDFLAPRVAKWQLPDDVVFIDEVPEDQRRQVLQEDPPRALRRPLTAESPIWARIVSESETNRAQRRIAPRSGLTVRRLVS